ncbi:MULTISPECIES: hypothetical protein [unclassified Microbacterium]|uniref:hypothetical protein n=1 Tax=unclassified Microbacterium TaxID=2609290 RepID=UPI0030104426
MTPDMLALDAARRSGDASYDPARGLLLIPTKPNPIHTRIVSGSAHGIRESLAYALALLELDGIGDHTVDGESRRARAARTLDAVADLQDTDPDSPTFGIWAYWAEEPLAEMVPPDHNWADFMGELLALILFRRADALGDELVERIRTALARAAAAIVRRNVDLDYTNIAVKGAFVTLAAGSLLYDAALTAYGTERLARLHDRLMRQRSIAEYNSPSYWHVVIQAFSAIRQYLPEHAVAAAELERVAWEHFLARWHPPTGQLSGPMARCYETNLRERPGPLLVVQRVAPESWTLFDPSTLPPSVHLSQDAVLDYRIPADLRPLLDRDAEPFVRETFADTHFIPGQVAGVSAAAAEGFPPVVVPTAGATWRGATATLGTVNHGDTWLQRRPLLGYWVEQDDDPTDPAQRARFIEVEVIRDGHGFAGGSFRAAQQGGDVLWSLGLATPSGDAHIHLDAIASGAAVATTELAVRFTLAGTELAEVRVDGEPAAPGTEHPDVRRLSVRSPAVAIDWELALAAFDGADRPASVRIDADRVVIEICWIRGERPLPLVIAQLGATTVAGRLRMRDAADAAELDDDAVLTTDETDGVIRLAHTGGDRTPLVLIAPTTPGSRLDHALVPAQADAPAPVR